MCGIFYKFFFLKKSSVVHRRKLCQFYVNETTLRLCNYFIILYKLFWMFYYGTLVKYVLKDMFEIRGKLISTFNYCRFKSFIFWFVGGTN